MRIIILIVLLLFSLFYIYPNDLLRKTEPAYLASFQNKPQKKEPKIYNKYTIFFYGGQYVNSNLVPIMMGDIKYLPSFIGVTGISVPLRSKFKKFAFESEGQLVKHFGLMNHYEVNTAVLARTNIMQSSFTFAFGEGISFATENPSMENRQQFTWLNTGSFNADPSVDSKRLLNFLVFELDYSLGNFEKEPKVFTRIHHRSGIFGLLCGPPFCGSNYLTYGVKFSL
jgi:hypothetical protein